MKQPSTGVEALRWALQADRYTNQTLHLGPANAPLAAPRSSLRGAATYPSYLILRFGMAAQMKLQRFILEQADANFRWDRVAAAAATIGTGNCMEFAATAFSYLRRANRSCELAYRCDADHAFVVIGRSGNPRDYRTWGDSCAICDPWQQEPQKRVYLGVQLATYMPHVRPGSFDIA